MESANEIARILLEANDNDQSASEFMRQQVAEEREESPEVLWDGDPGEPEPLPPKEEAQQPVPPVVEGKRKETKRGDARGDARGFIHDHAGKPAPEPEVPVTAVSGAPVVEAEPITGNDPVAAPAAQAKPLPSKGKSEPISERDQAEKEVTDLLLRAKRMAETTDVPIDLCIMHLKAALTETKQGKAKPAKARTKHVEFVKDLEGLMTGAKITED